MFNWSPQRTKNQNEAVAICDEIKSEIFQTDKKNHYR